MRKKFTMLLATFLVCLGGVKAQVKMISEIRENITDISTLEDKSYVIFKNVGRNGYVYEQSADKLMKLGTEAIVGGGAEYIWQVHKEDGGKYSFSSATGYYISTPLDGGNVYTVASDNENKDNFIITQHDENQENWKLQSSNDPSIYWDGQGADGSHRFVGWEGKGNNSQYQIIPVSVQEYYSLTVFYKRGEKTVHTETAAVKAGSNFNVTAPIFTTIESCSIGGESIPGDGNGIYSCSISKPNTEIMVQISGTSLDLTKTYRLKNVLSGLFMTIVETGQAEKIQIKNLSEDAAQKFTFEETQTKNGYKIKSENDTYYLTASGAWNYSATTEGSIHIIEEVGEGVYRLKSINGYIASNQNATADGSPMFSNHPQDRNTNTWEFVSTEKTPDVLLREEIAILKSEAESILADFSSINNIETTPFTETKEILTNAINGASGIDQVTDLNTLNEIKANLNTAINLSNKTTFHSGILASLEAGEYIVYYEDNSGNKHYLKNEENRVKSSARPTVYDVKNGVTEGGYVEYAYHFNMNNTNISNPTDDDAKEIQTDSRVTPRVWESQVLYVNSQGKYAIRSTNCSAGSGWNSDAFITISEDGTTVSGQNTDLSDALYIWNIKKVNAEASINNVKYETLTAAIEAADPGATVTLIDDITSSKIITINKAITLDGNGKTLTSTATRGINIETTGEVTVKNLKMNVTGERGFNVINEAGTTNIQGVTATAANYTVNVAGTAGAAKVNITDSHLTGLNVVNIAGPGAVITVNSSTLVCNDQNNNEYYAALTLNKDATNATITATNVEFDIKGDSKKAGNGAEGGTITIGNSSDEVAKFVAAIEYGDYYYSFESLAAAVAYAEEGETILLLNDVTTTEIITIDKSMTLDGNGKTLTSTAARGINIETTGEVTVKNLKMNVTGERGFNVINKAGTTNIQGVTATAANYTVNVAATAGAAKVNITGSQLTGLNVVNIAGPGAVITVNNSTLVCNDQNDNEYYVAMTLNKDATGATITATNVEFDIKGDSKRAGNGAEGGTITIGNSSDEVAKFVAAIEYGDYYYSFESLAAAVAYAEEGETILLLNDVTTTEIITIDKAITLNLNGKSITRADDYEGYVFEVTGELTVTGKGSIAEGGICYIINDADYKTEAGKTYAISEDKENVDIKYTRTFGHDSWQVLFVPFEIEVTEGLLNDFEVYTIAGVNEVRVEVADVTEGTTLSAHTPYLIKAKEIGEKTITATNVTLEATKDYVSEPINGYTFTGIYTSEAIAAHDKYVLTDGKWCRLSDKAVNDGNNVLGAFRVYLTAPNGTQANALSITRGETGIEELSTVNDQQSTVIYDLTGRKVETMDKGIYIVNGRKVVIK